MADDRYYKPGSHYIICDQSGFKTRSGNARKEWQGLLVNTRFYEPRQPQDLVTGVRDDQTVPDARPRQKDVFITLSTFVNGFVPARFAFIPVKSTVGFVVGMYVQVMLDDGSSYFAWVVEIDGSMLRLSSGPPRAITTEFENQVIVFPPPNGGGPLAANTRQRIVTNAGGSILVNI